MNYMRRMKRLNETIEKLIIADNFFESFVEKEIFLHPN
jgi:hypothetical protein